MLIPHVPTPLHVVDKVLELAGAGPGDILYDLGCGDGRIPITAVKKFNVSRAYCVEINDALAARAAAAARAAGVEGKVIVMNIDMYSNSYSVEDATVVTVFLLTSANRRLAPKLERVKARRVILHEFRFPEWRPAIYATINDGRVGHKLYLYIKGISF